MTSENFQPSFHALAIINLIGASQALLSAAALASAQRGNRLPNRYFAFFLTALSVYIIMAVLLETGYIIRVPYLMDIEDPFLFMLGPSFYFYIRAATGESFKLRGKMLLHFLPSLFFGLLWIAGLFISTGVKIAGYLNRLANPDKFDPAQLIALLIIDFQIFVYLIAGWRKLANFAKRAEPAVLNRVGTDWRWLRNLFAALFAVALFSTILDVLSFDLENMRFTPFLLTIILCSLSYFGLRQSGLIPISKGEKARKSGRTFSITSAVCALKRPRSD